MVGSSGSTSERTAEVTANARSLPALMCSIAGGVVENTPAPVRRSGRSVRVPRRDKAHGPYDFRHDLEQFGGHVGHGANASRSKVDLARIGFRMGNKFGDCLGRKRWMHHQDMRATGDTRDRCDIAEKNEIEFVVECRVDYVRRTASEERVAIGW